MKCPQCGVHYDDSEKECPMCGARRPAFGMDASRLAKTAGSLVQLEEPEKRKKRQRRKTDSEAHPTALNGKPYKPKKKWGPVKIILLVIILVNFLPMLLGFLFGIAEEVIWKVEDTVSDWGADEWNEPLPHRRHKNNLEDFFAQISKMWNDGGGRYVLVPYKPEIRFEILWKSDEFRKILQDCVPS